MDYKPYLVTEIKELFIRKINIREISKGRKLYYNIFRIRYYLI